MVGYLLLLAILWWGVSWKLGAKLFAVLVLSVYVNALIKELVAEPRPFDYADFESVTRPGEFSFPSGHAQHAALFWTLVATHFRKRWVTLGAATMAFLIGFSRMYLGVHFPTDVLAGWLLVGLVGLPVLYLALAALSPSETSRIYYLHRWMRFATIGLWVSCPVPKLVAYRKKDHEDLDAASAR